MLFGADKPAIEFHVSNSEFRVERSNLEDVAGDQEPIWAGGKRYCAALLCLFPLGAAQQGQDEQIGQDVDDTAAEHNQTKTLRWRKIG